MSKRVEKLACKIAAVLHADHESDRIKLIAIDMLIAECGVPYVSYNYPLTKDDDRARELI